MPGEISPTSQRTDLELLRDMSTAISYLAQQLARVDAALQARLAERAVDERSRLRLILDEPA